VYYFGTGGNTYLYFDGTYHNLNGGNLIVTSGVCYLANTGVYIQNYSGSLYTPNNFRASGYIMSDNTTYYLGSSGSYYINLSSNVMQCVSVNLLSWGWVGFNGNSAINFSWDGTWQVASQNLRTAGSFQAQGYINAIGRLISSNWDVGEPGNIGGAGGSGGNVSLMTQRSIMPMRDYADQQANSNAIVVPNIGDYRGQPLAQTWGTWSSKRFKRNVRSIADALSLVKDDALHGVYYDNVNTPMIEEDPSLHPLPRDPVPETTPCVGFIADDWLERVPEIVFTDADGEAEYMDYSRVGAVLWEAFKQYVAMTDARIADLEARLADATPIPIGRKAA
jgi:hypothetical protein